MSEYKPKNDKRLLHSFIQFLLSLVAMVMLLMFFIYSIAGTHNITEFPKKVKSYMYSKKLNQILVVCLEAAVLKHMDISTHPYRQAGRRTA